MAFLFVDLTQNNNRYVQISVKILELLLLSTGLFSTLLMVKGALPPHSCDLVFSSLIEFWTSITCFLSSPLSICIIIHLIVVLIVASSNFFNHENGLQDDEISIVVGDHHVVQLSDALVSPSPPPSPPPRIVYEVPTSVDIGKEEGHTLDEAPTSVDIGKEDGHTLDATWEAITGERKKKEKKKHLKKNETWARARPSHSGGVHVPSRLDSEILLPTGPKWKELRKAETFNDAVSVTRRGGLVRRDPSMSIEEFNLRVDAFIKKFNDNMRLQRQESNQTFFETINRGI